MADRRQLGYVSSTTAQTIYSLPDYGTATGGIGSPTSVTISGINYQYLQFNATGTLTVTKSGLFDIYIFGGGGGGGGSVFTAVGGGGGAGGATLDTIYLDTNQTITIGGGGAASGGQGVDSKIQQTSLTSVQPAFVYGGGYGGGYWGGAGKAPATGGSARRR